MPLIKGTKYEEIYDKFAKCITDYNLFELLQSDDAESQKFVENMLEGFLMSSVAKFYKCTKDLSNRDEILKQFNFVLDDLEIEILALMMVAEWVEPQLNSTSYTLQFIGGTNTKYYAQANQLDKLMQLEKSSRIKARKLIRDYTYKTSMENLG